MEGWVAVTHDDWFDYLAERVLWDEVNFWTPSDYYENDYSFSEQDLVRFFRGERREMERYIIDAQRDGITHDQNNAILEFVEWAGKAADRPLS